jgi:hypothetical protein
MNAFTRRVASALLVAFALSRSVAAEAADVSTTKTWTIGAGAEDVLAVIKAYDKYCAKGCTYRVPSIVAAKILDYSRHPDSYYVWTSIQDIKNATWFSHVDVTRTAQKIHVEERMVTAEVGATLAKATGLKHEPAVDSEFSAYDLVNVTAAGAAVPSTRVTFTTTIGVSGFSAWFGTGIVRERLEDAAKAVHENFEKMAHSAHSAAPTPVPSAAPSAKP